MKKGDLVVCIDNDLLHLTFGKVYSIIGNTSMIIMVVCDDGFTRWFLGVRFILLSEMRKNKLKKLEQL